jgi:hypothetical protein
MYSKFHMNKTISFTAIAAIMLALFVALHGVWRTPEPALPTGTTTPLAISSGAAPALDTAPSPLPPASLPAKNETASAAAPAIATSAAPITEPVTLIVGGTSYRAELTASHTVLDMMRALSDADASFSFEGENYPSLGFFVSAIDGKKSGGGYNWMLYVNGKQSSTGASQTKLSNGDTVEWKYER